jgi:hypothetical protein
MSDEILTLTGIVSSFAGGVISSACARYLDERWFGPKLSIHADNGPEYKVERPYNQADEDSSNIYIRVKVTNDSKRIAKQCTAWLADVQEVRNGQAHKTSSYHDSKQLPWAGSKREPIDIPYGTAHYVDVVVFSKHEPGWRFPVKLFASQQELTRYKGTYRLTVLVTSDGAKPVSRQIDVTYHGDWNTLRIDDVR